MNVRIPALIALTLLLAFTPVVRAQSTDESGVSLALGTAAPDATLQDLDGNSVQLLNYVKKGKPALIEFWATWCELCAALQPQLDQIEAQHGKDLNVVAVAVGVAQTVRRVKRHLDDHNPGYPYLWDGRGTAVRAYNATTTSIVVMLNAEGKVVYTGVGKDQDLTGAVDKLLGI
jgi:thiol-disulfide isomerase/thioredoxin